MDKFLDPRVQSAFLKHTLITSEQQLICSLLCTSRSLRSSVLSACSELISIQLVCTEQQQQRPLQLASWLRSNACLAKSLHLELKLLIGYGFNWKEAVAAIAAALQHAAAAGVLHLQNCHLSGVKASAAVLAALPHTLTSLSCWLEYDGPELATVLGLTALKQLELEYTAGYDNVSLQLPAQLQNYTALQPLSVLQQLTHLSLKSIRPAHLQYLPAQLQELSADVMGSPFVGETKQYLSLQHLTRLTLLESRGDLMAHRICEGDLLPPQLRVLIWPDVDGSVTPLLQLSSLQSLQLHHCWTTPVGQLHLLSSTLSTTPEVQLAYYNGRVLKGLAAGLAAAPVAGLSGLRALTIDLSRHSGFGCGPLLANGTGEACVDHRVVQHLHKLQGLTSLVIRGLPQGKCARPPNSRSVLGAPLQWLTSALGALTALQHLQLEGFDGLHSATATALYSGLEIPYDQALRVAQMPQRVEEFVQTLVNIKSLRSLSLSLPIPFGSHHVLALATASQLTSLVVSGLGLKVLHEVDAVSSSFSSIKHLHLS